MSRWQTDVSYRRESVQGDHYWTKTVKLAWNYCTSVLEPNFELNFGSEHTVVSCDTKSQLYRTSGYTERLYLVTEVRISLSVTPTIPNLWIYRTIFQGTDGFGIARDNCTFWNGASHELGNVFLRCFSRLWDWMTWPKSAFSWGRWPRKSVSISKSVSSFCLYLIASSGICNEEEKIPWLRSQQSVQRLSDMFSRMIRTSHNGVFTDGT